MIPPLVMFLWVPESPKWIIHQNRREEAYNTLLSLRDAGADIESELNDMAAEHGDCDSAKDEVTWSEVFACKHAMIIGIGLMICSAGTGINSVMFYSSAIFGFAGFDQAILGKKMCCVLLCSQLSFAKHLHVLIIICFDRCNNVFVLCCVVMCCVVSCFVYQLRHLWAL